MSYTITQADMSDIPGIDRLFRQMLESIYGSSNVQGYDPGYLDKFFDGSGNTIYSAKMNGQIVGYLSVELHDGAVPFIYLDDLCVEHSFRKNGIGSALMSAAEVYAVRHQAAYIDLHVENSNHRAVNLYTQLGYNAESPDVSRIRMRKSIV